MINRNKCYFPVCICIHHAIWLSLWYFDIMILRGRSLVVSVCLWLCVGIEIRCGWGRSPKWSARICVRPKILIQPAKRPGAIIFLCILEPNALWMFHNLGLWSIIFLFLFTFLVWWSDLDMRSQINNSLHSNLDATKVVLSMREYFLCVCFASDFDWLLSYPSLLSFLPYFWLFVDTFMVCFLNIFIFSQLEHGFFWNFLFFP